jgi:hypothetical protein
LKSGANLAYGDLVLMDINFHTIKSESFKIVLSLCFFSIPVNVLAPEAKVLTVFVSEPVNPYERLVNAIIRVESKGDTLAYNKIEEAAGAFQIRPIRLRDYNNRTGNKYTHNDCFKLTVSKEIFLYYANKIGYPNYESIARDWNGSGKTTLDYWKKVRIYL